MRAAVAVMMLALGAAAAGKPSLPVSFEIQQFIFSHRALDPRWQKATLKDTTVKDLHEVEGFSLLQKSRIFMVCTTGDLLSWRLLPTSETCGYFSTEAGGIHYLSAEPASGLSRILQLERPSLSELPAERLAWLLTEFALPSRGENCFHTPLQSSDAVSQANAKWGAGYRMEHPVQLLLKRHVKPPRVTGNARTGWSVEVFTMDGWMHRIDAITRHVFHVSSGFELGVSSKTLVEKPFSSVPVTAY